MVISCFVFRNNVYSNLFRVTGTGGHFKIFPLYKVNTEGDFLRRRKETLLINILKLSLNEK
jgi:hypothetical protein